MIASKEKIVFDSLTQMNIDQWLNGQCDNETKVEIQRLIEKNPKEVIDSFYTTLSFGTGGLRGIMGVGSNRMNRYTISQTTQGLANYINKQPPKQKRPSIIIGYDSRHHSKEFAEEAAKVMAANGIHVYLFKELRPVPLVSFGCRYKKCQAAIVITASHNPPQYNGYKVYWDDGGQVLPPHDQGIIQEVNQINDFALVKKVTTLNDPLIEIIDYEIDEAYIKAISLLQNYPLVNQEKGNNLKIVYSSLHGTGVTLVPKVLADWGFTQVSFVDEQMIIDGDFPTAKFPNPEEPSALAMGIEKLMQTGSDILIETDPDADRIGVVINHRGHPVILNGNQVAAIFLNHICQALTTQKRMPVKAAFVKTIGTTELFQAICDHFQKPCFNVLTGFKYIAEKIRLWEKDSSYEFIFGGEESYGYLSGTNSRDKDAVLCCALICEVALQAQLKGKTLLDVLYDIYQQFGVYQEKLISVQFEETKEGKEKMSQAMTKIRHSPFKEINGIAVQYVEDFLNSTKMTINEDIINPIAFPKSDVLIYWLADQSKVMVRPSGTEPKVKLYCGVVEKTFSSIPDAITQCEKKAQQILLSLKKIIES